MESSSSTFEVKLLSSWDVVYSNPATGDGAFLSKIDNFEIRKLEKGYISYYNRSLVEKKPPTQVGTDAEKPETKSTSDPKESEKKESITLPFDDTKFNFLKTKPFQTLLYYDEENGNFVYQESDSYFAISKVPPTAFCLIGNGYPVARYHTIIVPRPLLKLPQIFREDCFVGVLHLYNSLNSNEFCIAYNSVLAGASVNQLHLHIFHIPQIISSGELAIESAKTELIKKISFNESQRETDLSLEETTEYPVKAFVIRAPSLATTKEKEAIFEQIAKVIGKIVSVLLKEQIPHNVVAVKGGTSVFILPRKSSTAGKDVQPRPTWIELVGIRICHEKQAYDNLTAESYEEFLKKEISVGAADFKNIKETALSLL